MPNDMPDSLEEAIFRLDAAVTRAETAFANRPPAPPKPAPTESTDPVDPDLPARHAKLRAGTEAALAKLDTLIAAERG
ncbi:hypothetical protein GCM10011404_24900 [Sphingomonas prati]|nr:hypothetical protein GCM10011404_24900 [Sphingomonas prati]